jgi:hypothetical protein
MKFIKWIKKSALKNQTKKIPVSIEHQENLPDWAALFARQNRLWHNSKKNAQNGPNILIATTVGGFAALSSLESLLAVALTLRGARVHTLLCDAALPACLRVENPTIPDPKVIADYGIQKRLCDDCQRTGQYLFEPLGLQNHKLGDQINVDERQLAKTIASEVPMAEIPSYQFNGISVGEHAYAGALRYFASGNLDSEPLGETVVRRYLEAAILTAVGLKHLLTKVRFQSSCFNHGIYCPQGVIGEVLRKAGTHVVNWNIAYRKKCFIFSHGDTYHHTLLDEPTDVWESMEWNSNLESQTQQYLRSRWQGSNDWIWFHEKPEERFDKIATELELDRSKPIIGMLTNVMWDAQLHYRANAFPNMLSWVLDTIDFFAQKPDLQLVIRIHPAEIRGTLPSRQPLLQEIRKVWSTLPQNVKLIPPESPVSTYAIMEHCDSVLIYGTKTGVELTSSGIPVIVAGEAWVRNKGITLDASTRDEYMAILASLPLGKRLDDATRERALKYACHFFFRRMIPVQFMEPTGAWPPYKPSIESLEQLMPGVDTGLDIICDGILKGSPFIYPVEKFIKNEKINS